MPAGQERGVGLLFNLHGDEEISRDFYESLKSRQPQRNIEVKCGNPRAAEQGLRYTEENPQFCFPGDPESDIHERRLAAELLLWAAQFDVVLDVHNNQQEGNDQLWLHPESNLTLRGISAALGIDRIILPPPGAMNYYAKNVALIDLSMNTKITAMDIHCLAYRLSQGQQWYTPREELMWYELYKSIIVPDTPPAPFEPLPAELKHEFDLPAKSHALAYLKRPDDSYWLEVIERCEDPWVSQYQGGIAA